MFCNQCEQTARGQACTVKGVCGKESNTAELQDKLIFSARRLAVAALAAREKNIIYPEIDRHTAKAVFTTLTNVQFDNKPLKKLIEQTDKYADQLAKESSFNFSGPLASDSPIFSTENLSDNKDINSLMQLLLYGLKGTAAYIDHAAILGEEDSGLYAMLYEGLAAGFDGKERGLEEWIATVMACGTANLKAMETLDKANTGTYGHPEPTEVSLAPVVGKAILVTGHDLKDLYTLLEATKDTGINIYTHGEMLPCNAYPGLKKYDHLVGHYGTAWQNQQKEMPKFPGAILFTTNCIQKPLDSYADNVFTTGLVGWPGIKHVSNDDFSEVIKKAQELPGFTKEDVEEAPKGKVLAGFGHNAVMSVADKVIEGVKAGDIKHFFLVGGCDGAKPGRNYYTEFVEKAPKDTIILTLACGKFRFFDKDLGNIGGIPRLLDVGQCNDAYSAIQIALALAGAFECGVNELPLSLVLSWYEQKAVAILLTLLSLGIKNIRLGPTLPAFVSPAVLNVLVENFNIAPISTPDEDLKAILG